MHDPDGCSHDFRRVFPADIRGQVRVESDSVLAVLCCNCGKSPLYVLTKDKGLGSLAVNGRWPYSRKIIDYSHDDIEGPSVEFIERPDPDAD